MITLFITIALLLLLAAAALFAIINIEIVANKQKQPRSQPNRTPRSSNIPELFASVAKRGKR